MPDTTASPSPRECAALARKLAPRLRDALRAWARHGAAAMLGAVLDDKPRTSYAIRPHVIGSRQVDVLRKHKLAEAHLLWLCLTLRGRAVARWLANMPIDASAETAVVS